MNARRVAWLPLMVLVGISAGRAAEPSNSPLADAAEARDWVRVESLLAAKADVDAAQPDGTTALHWAVLAEHEPTVRRLIAAGADANAATRYRVTPLSIACSLGSSAIVDQLLEAGANANTALPGGETPLHTAARAGSAESIRLLLAHGAKIDASERRGQTALMWAAAEGHVEAVDRLLESGAKVDATTKSGWNAWFFAAREGHIAVCERLLAAGVDVNAVMQPTGGGERVPRKGTSALLLAVESGHFELAMRLVEAGADPNDQRSGYAPLHVLSWVRKPDRGENAKGDPPPRGSGNLTDLEFVRAIVAAGADVNLRLDSGSAGKAELNPRGGTPFLFAARTADLPLMTLLHELGADPLAANVDGCTPLMAAAGVGVRAVGEEAGTEPEVLEALALLVELGAGVNTIDDNRETAMHGAAYRNFPRVVEFLAAHGADPARWNHRNESGWTPMRIAEGYRPGSFKPSPETIRALEAALAGRPQ